tara:strand:+ start:418 stop:855 length:438 start_codon:yes stop_codon:yes gene_type:complete
MPNYKDTALNRRMGRVGKPHGSSPVTKAKLKARPAKNYRKKGGADEKMPMEEKPKKKKVFKIKRTGTKKEQYQSSLKKLHMMDDSKGDSVSKHHIKVGGQRFSVAEANQITDPDYQKGRLLQTAQGQRIWSKMNRHREKYFPNAL